MELILASSSEYRARMLAKLNLKFTIVSPEIDETPLRAETARDLAARLTVSKARKVADRHKNCLIIASDQACSLEGRILGKPGNLHSAEAQLAACSGKKVTFYTGVTLLNTDSFACQMAVEEFSVQFKKLTSKQIHNYLIKETPYNCAGSFKIEGLGIALFDRLTGSDINSLIGLPLIQLVDFLDNEGIDVLSG